MTSSIYLKKNMDYNNVFLEDGKILKVGRSPEVPWSLPHLPPVTAFFSWGRNILFQISGGAYSQGGHMPPLFWNRGGAYAHCAPRLRTPLYLLHILIDVCISCFKKITYLLRRNSTVLIHVLKLRYSNAVHPK